MSPAFARPSSMMKLGEDGTAMLPRHHSSPICTAENHEQILGLTAELFPDAKISVQLATDPEIGEDAYCEISVITPGEIQEIAEQDRRWHQQLRLHAPKTASFYRLLIEVR